MDDVLMIINDEGWGGAEKVFEEFTTAGGCYPEPLSLSEDSGETYLECVLHNKGGEFLLQLNIGIKMGGVRPNKDFTMVLMLTATVKKNTKPERSLEQW